MFWFKNQNTDKQKKKPAGATAGQALGCEGGSSKDGQNGKSQRLREEALASARTARMAIGEETLDKVAAAMTKRQQSATEQAKKQINQANPDKVLDELLYILKNKS